MNENQYKATYICFNDEAGNLYDKKLRYYVRCSLIVNTNNIKDIENKIMKIRKGLNLSDLKEEIKWHDLWELKKCFEENKIPKGKLKNIYTYLKKLKKNYILLIDYCEQIFKLLNEPSYDIKVILSFTQKDKYPHHKEKDIYKFHIQDHLQRIQMQLPNSITIIIYDSIDNKRKKLFKEIYNEIITVGDFIREYNAVFKSLLFDDSYDNKFLQIVDFIAGSFSNTLKAIAANDTKNYVHSTYFFYNLILPLLCKNERGEVWGIGIKETPKNEELRKFYMDGLEKLKSIIGK